VFPGAEEDARPATAAVVPRNHETPSFYFEPRLKRNSGSHHYELDMALSIVAGSYGVTPFLEDPASVYLYK
jgi:hypothetical protein